jgi:hypothetical protein
LPRGVAFLDLGVEFILVSVATWQVVVQQFHDVATA